MITYSYDLHTVHKAILKKRKKKSINHTSKISINYITANVKE